MIVDIDNIKSFYKRKGAGNCILFLHGWGCDCNTLDILYDNLEGDCISVDMLGFGKSSCQPCAYDTTDYAEYIYKMLCRLGVAKVTIIGHSFGGRVGIALAAMYPRIVEKLILIGSAGLNMRGIKKSLKIAIYKLKKWLVKVKILNKSALDGSGSVDYKALKSQVERQTFVKVTNQDLTAYAKKIVCPTLLIYGSEDKDTPIKLAKRLNKYIKDSGLVIVEGAGHYCFIDKAYFVLTTVKYFVGVVC